MTLLRCPFCTCTAIEAEGDGEYAWIECPACGACGPSELTPARAKAAWNFRDESVQWQMIVENLESQIRGLREEASSSLSRPQSECK